MSDKHVPTTLGFNVERPLWFQLNRNLVESAIVTTAQNCGLCQVHDLHVEQTTPASELW